MPYKDIETRRAYLREYKRKHKQRLKPMNADSDRARHANQRAALYGVPGRITIEGARSVLAAGKCHYCGSLDRLELDHVIPMHAGGPNDLSNIVAACHACNASKWRAEAPGRWSRLYDACRGCGSTDRRHSAQGYCNACYLARFGSRAKAARA